MQCCVLNTNLSRPFFHGKCHAVEAEHPISSFITILFVACCPSTIFWRIWTIIILAIKTMFWRSISHVSIEVFKNFPFRADFNSACSIITETFILRILTSPFHLLPALISSRFVTTRHAVSTESKPSILNLKATTTSSLATKKISGKNNFYLTTITSAMPQSMSVLTLTSPGNDGQSRESLTKNVFYKHDT